MTSLYSACFVRYLQGTTPYVELTERQELEGYGTYVKLEQLGAEQMRS